MLPEKVWENVFKFDTYSKGGEYSASDIIGEVLAVKLRKDNPNHKSEVTYEDRISAWVGTACHERAEQWLQAENNFGETNMQSEVKLKFRNISGTADLVFDNETIGDYKTGKGKNIQTKLRELANGKKSSWQEQLSIYTYLNHKQNGAEYGTIGYIFWLCIDTNKHGVEEVKLLAKEQTIELIKNFLVAIEEPIEEMNQCNLCVQFMNRWCGVRSICPKWGADEDWADKVEEW